MASPSTPSIHKRSNNDASSSTPPVHKRFRLDASPSTPFIHKRFTYDVFLSFRGIDTRKNFVDHLFDALQHKGIHTYKDDERIKKGKKISDELIGSIEDSKFYIIVFSKNYASSSWCLDELVKIMECQKTTDHTAYPVFYDVEPTEVRHQSGAVEEAFKKHENKAAAGKWRMALKEAADLAGWELKNTADGHEAKFIQKIVEELSLVLRGINFNIDEKLVGMETRINDVLSSLRTGCDDVHIIGIKGMGGGGKTTLARAIFDKISFRFDGKSFAENVREVSKASLLGLKSLQHQILYDVFNDKGMTVSSVHEGIGMMKRMMPFKEVILVLDDVDHRDQLKALAGDMTWFKPGSVIIITTRDRQVLEFYEEKFIHDVQLLSHKDAMCLFRRYAFGKVIPNPRYEKLSAQFVQYAAGLPLAIEVLGSFLCGKDELEWTDALSRLKTIPAQEILEVLEISYSGLENDYKEIFLNVACFLKGWQKAKAIKALESCGFSAQNGLRVLELKSLITVDKYGFLGMHDHIEEMGKNIVRRSHPDNPHKHSRLWIHEEIKEILAKDSGTKKTRYIQFDIGKFSPEIAMQGLRKMKELRFLHLSRRLYDASESQNWKCNELPNALRYLCWNSCPFRSLPTAFQADNLVSLEMPNSRIVQLWEGGERKVLNKLRFLNLSGSELRTFDLGVAPNLEKLNLRECVDLIELRLPHRCLNLRSLKLNHSKLRTLDIGLSPNLEHLNLTNCRHLEKFNMANGCLRKLVYLNLSNTLRFESFEFQIQNRAFCSADESLEGGPLAELHLIAKSVDECRVHPDSNLPKFQFECYYKEEPLLTRNLEKLISVGLCACTTLDTFSRSICGLQHLRKLNLSGSELRTFDLGVAPNLEELDLRECVDLIELRLPHRCLNLRSLKLNHSKLRTLDLRLAPDLQTLDLGECEDLIELRLPERCLNLRFLNLSHSKLRTFDLGVSPNLETMNLEYCLDLIELRFPHRCLNLRFLKLSYLKLRTLDIGLSPNLEHLNLTNCRHLEEFHMADGCLRKLVYLNLSNTLRFESFEFQIQNRAFCSADESLEGGPLAELHLIAKSVDECRVHPDSNLPKFQFECYYKEEPLLTRNLEKLISVGLCACTNLDTFSRSICGLQHLRKLKLEGSILEAPKDLDQLECLQHLDFSDTNIKHLPDNICVLKHLKSIDLSKCWLLEKLPEDLGQLECLKNLDLFYTDIEVLPGSICKLKHLEYLRLDGCSLLQKLPEDLGQLEGLKSLSLRKTAVRDLPDGICMLKHLEVLDLYHCSLLQKLPENLGLLQCLKMLDLSTANIKDLPDSICMLKNLERLILDDCSLLEKLPDDLGRLECLENLYLRGCELLREVPDSICQMKFLVNLDLGVCIRVEKLPEEIGRLECLKLLVLKDTGISHLPQSILLLKGLRIYGSRGLIQSCGFTSEIQSGFLDRDSYYVDV